ncbi:MAG: response regulator transcription factor [Phycisphaerae bacterium]|nr:response regulator transcription factor [Phycisphaerae bacterium]
MSGGHPIAFVVDDDEGARESLVALMTEVGIRTRAHATAEDFLAEYDPDQAGCLIVDVRLPGMSGLELQERLSAKKVCLPVILITGYGDVEMAVRALQNGAEDFLEKPVNEQLLLERVRRSLCRSVESLRRRTQVLTIGRRAAELSPREREVMEMVVSGRSNKDIAGRLKLSTKTVETHRRNVMAKMQAGSVAELVRMAVLLEYEQSNHRQV